MYLKGYHGGRVGGLGWQDQFRHLHWLDLPGLDLHSTSTLADLHTPRTPITDATPICGPTPLPKATPLPGSPPPLPPPPLRFGPAHIRNIGQIVH